MRNRKSNGAGLSGSERAAEVWDAIIEGDAQKLVGLAVERVTAPNIADADTPGAFITKRIHDMFCELAEKASKMELTEDESAGVPMTLFAAENYLLNCWKAYTQDETPPTSAANAQARKASEVHLPNCPIYPQWPWPPDHTA